MRPLFLEELAVHPRFQGTGVGSFVLEQVEHLARVRGCTHLVLEVAENNENALKFYRKRSFYKLDAAIFLAKKVHRPSDELLPPAPAAQAGRGQVAGAGRGPRSRRSPAGRSSDGACRPPPCQASAVRGRPAMKRCSKVGAAGRRGLWLPSPPVATTRLASGGRRLRRRRPSSTGDGHRDRDVDGDGDRDGVDRDGGSGDGRRRGRFRRLGRRRHRRLPRGARAACDPLVPTQCGFPFPSDFWLVDDASARSSGQRVAFVEGSAADAPGRPVPLPRGAGR
jgi:hypothetical protein